MSLFGNMVDLGVTQIHECDGVVELWRVRGIDNTFYPTKMVAEIAARATFPKDEMAANYGRISYVRFHNEKGF